MSSHQNNSPPESSGPASSITSNISSTIAEEHNSPQQVRSMNEVGQQEALDKRQQLEEEERKLLARHPSVQQRPVSEFLQKRLQRGQRYFDSGDYNMAKASTNPNIKLPEEGTPVTAAIKRHGGANHS